MAKALKTTSVVTEEPVDETNTETTETVETEEVVDAEAEQDDAPSMADPVGRVAAFNKFGHRTAMVNDRGELTIIDDDTALILFRSPYFYRELFDSGRGKHIDIGMFRWADEFGNATNLVVGQPYEVEV